MLIAMKSILVLICQNLLLLIFCFVCSWSRSFLFAFLLHVTYSSIVVCIISPRTHLSMVYAKVHDGSLVQADTLQCLLCGANNVTSRVRIVCRC